MMKSMKAGGLLLAIGVILVASAGVARASTVGPYTSSISDTTTDWTGTLTFPQFNPSLGTLTQVELDLSTTIHTTLTVTNTDVLSGSSGNAKTEVQITVQDAGLNLTAPELDLLDPTAGYGYALGPGGSVTSGLLTKTGSSADFYSSGLILSEFTGLGNIGLNAGTFTQTDLSNTGGNTNSSQVTDALLTGQVIYTYEATSVPLPAALPMGLACLGMWRLVRRRHA